MRAERRCSRGERRVSARFDARYSYEPAALPSTASALQMSRRQTRFFVREKRPTRKKFRTIFERSVVSTPERSVRAERVGSRGRGERLVSARFDTRYEPAVLRPTAQTTNMGIVRVTK